MRMQQHDALVLGVQTQRARAFGHIGCRRHRGICFCTASKNNYEQARDLSKGQRAHSESEAKRPIRVDLCLHLRYYLTLFS